MSIVKVKSVGLALFLTGGLAVDAAESLRQAVQTKAPAAGLPAVNAARTLPVKKDVFHRFEKLRSGQIKTAQGCNVTDFGVSMYNPNPTPITVTWKLIADDPNFTYLGGARGTWSKTFDLQPDDGITDNVYAGCYTEGTALKWPVPVEANWTGVIEFSAEQPFYAYVLWIDDIEGPQSMPAVKKSWLLWAGEVQVNWDKERNQFISPYTNYWLNDPFWLGGWYTRLILVNRGDKEVSYQLNHKSYYYGERTYHGEPPATVRFGTAVKEFKLKPGAKADLRLEQVFGWDQPNWSSKMEGRLCVTPAPLAAAATTEVKLFIIPGRVTLDSLKEQEQKALSEEVGVVVRLGNGVGK